MTLRRKFTDREQLECWLLGAEIGVSVDRALGRLIVRLGDGDEILPELHDRLNVLGHFVGADRLRRLIERG